MDRQVVFNGQIPLDTDILKGERNAMVGIAKLAHAILGDGPYLNSLACTPTSPASLQVQVAPGQIYQLASLDATAFGSLAADTTHQILKQGLLMDAVTLSCPAPGTAGQSINYLIQVGYLETDGGSTVLPYYNSSNPAVAYNGPNNTGVSQNTIRQGVCSVTVKAGTAATTGTQSTPAADSGYTGAYVVTVANGQTTIISGNISTYAGAPFIADKLQAKITQAQGDTRYAQYAASNTWTAQQAFAPATLTDGATINWDVSTRQVAKVTLAGNRTLANPTNMTPGCFYTLTVTQDATGSRTLAFGTAYKWTSGSAPTLTPTAAAVDLLQFYCPDGTNMYGSMLQDVR